MEEEITGWGGRGAERNGADLGLGMKCSGGILKGRKRGTEGMGLTQKFQYKGMGLRNVIGSGEVRR